MSVLHEAEELVMRGARRAVYGPPVEAMRRLAAGSEAEGRTITPRQVEMVDGSAGLRLLAREAQP